MIVAKKDTNSYVVSGFVLGAYRLPYQKGQAIGVVFIWLFGIGDDRKRRLVKARVSEYECRKILDNLSELSQPILSTGQENSH